MAGIVVDLDLNFLNQAVLELQLLDLRLSLRNTGAGILVVLVLFEELEDTGTKPKGFIIAED